MRTVVYQSYRTTRVPAWIESCMQTVRSWAAANAFDYRFIDDRLFDYVPPWFRQKAGREICPVADLARLALAREFLDQGYERTIWVDADMLVFAPERMVTNIEQGFAFCHEVWLAPDANGRLVCDRRVNNSVTVFTRGSIHLDFLIDACLRIARHKPRLGKFDVGTLLLSQLRTIIPFPLLANVGMFSPAIMADIASGTEHYLPSYAQQLTVPLACANLCSSLAGQQFSGMPADDRLYDAVVEQCLQTRGEVVNRFLDNARLRA
jgi:hypothetical protein